MTEIYCPICKSLSKINDPNNLDINSEDNYYAVGTLDEGNFSSYYDSVIPYSCLNGHNFYICLEEIVIK